MQATLQAHVSGEIRAELARRGKSQRALSEHLGISASQLSARLSGEVEWRLTELDAVAQMLGLSLRDLLPEPVAT